MSVHPDYAKRYNQARDLRRIAISASTRVPTNADIGRLHRIADDLRESADLVKNGGYLIATLFWPEDPERGSEVYGPFANEQARVDWVNEVTAAAEAGDATLNGVHFILDRMVLPFEVRR